MPALIRPDARVHRSFAAAMAEFRAEGGIGMADEMTDFPAAWWDDPAEFTRYLGRLAEDARDDLPRPGRSVPQTTLWWVSGEDYLGRVSIRHRLTTALRDVGGHIGYDIRPSARQRGHATAMLAAALPVARSFGITRALLTCNEDNLASRKVIEANGGVPAGHGRGQLRYWVPAG